jgi:ribosomal protein S18 acetylase RimI-like enzyme
VSVEIRREDYRALGAHSAISIAFDVREAVQLPVVAGDALHHRIVSPGYLKDYDAIPGNDPRDWPARFAVDRAELLAAYLDGERVGGAVAVVEPSDVARLGGEPPLAVLWDLRVAPETRGRGVGRTLLAAMEARMREIGLPGITGETQDINVAACRLYASAGYRITRTDANAYAELPSETQIIWTKRFR